MTTPSDGALVQRLRTGDIQAFSELVVRYQQFVYNVCWRMLGEHNEAEDLTQEAFIRAYQRMDTFDNTRPFGPWIRRIAANMCLNHIQRRPPAMMPLDDEQDRLLRPSGVNPENARQRAETKEAIHRALLELPPHYRAVIELRHFQQLSYEEMAAALNLPLNTAKSHLFRARKQLGKMLAEARCLQKT